MLRSLPILARLGLTALLATMFIGAAASAFQVLFHYDKRDDVPGFSIDDIKAAYHGLDAPSKLLTALERNHPEPPHALSKDDRDTLLKWLQSPRIQEDFQSPDLGPQSPAEIVASNCASCHSPAAKPPFKSHPLTIQSWSDVQKIAFSRKVEPTPMHIITLSAHTHAPAMAMMGIIAAALIMHTRLPRAFSSALIAILGVSLFADIASWFLTRHHENFAYVIFLAGAIFNATFTLAILLTLADLWLPTKRSKPA